MKNERERMGVVAGYCEVGTYRGAAELYGTTHKTVRRIVEAHEAAARGEAKMPRVEWGHNFEEVATLVVEKVARTGGKVSAKRLLPVARAAGYAGSDRDFRRLVAEAKRVWRAGQAD